MWSNLAQSDTNLDKEESIEIVTLDEIWCTYRFTESSILRTDTDRGKISGFVKSSINFARILLHRDDGTMVDV